MDCKTVAMPLEYVTCMSPASSESSTSASGSELSWEVVGLEAVPDESLRRFVCAYVSVVAGVCHARRFRR